MFKNLAPFFMLLGAALAPCCFAQDAKQGLHTLYDFKCCSTDAYQTNSALLLAGTGALIGVTTQGGNSNHGTIYTLTPPSFPKGPWAESVLYRFNGGADGDSPLGPLVIDKTHRLYGVSAGGAATCGVHANAYCGLVFVLEPPAVHGGSWHKKALHNLGPLGVDGWSPSSALLQGANGVLYGATRYGAGAPTKPCPDGCGTIYSLTPPSAGGSWTSTMIYQFLGGKDGEHPSSNLVADSNGVLYGASEGGDPKCPSGCGTIYSLTPPSAPGGAWTHTVLHYFTNSKKDGGLLPGGVVVGRSGILYGTTSSGGKQSAGVIFALVPPSTPKAGWHERVLYTFQNTTDGGAPFAGLAIGASGTIYGTTFQGGDLTCAQAPTTGCGTVYSLAPPSSPGGSWTFKALHAFSGGDDGGLAVPGITLSSHGILYGTTWSGGTDKDGTVYSLVP